jgi:general secretion pathway protein B
VSYILDALRRAERERRAPRAPTLDAVHRPVPARRRSPWPWLLGAALLVVALNGALLAWLWRGGAGEPVARATVVSSPAPVAPSPPVSPPTPTPVVSASPAPRPPSVAPAASAPVAAAVSAVPAGPAPTVAAAPAPAPLPPAPTAAAPAPPPPFAPAAPVEATGALREAATRMSLDVLVFSEEDAARFVFINGRKLVEGQTVEGGIVVEAITREGAILALAGERLVLRPKSNPYLR